MLDAAKIRNIVERCISSTMHAAVAKLIILFVQTCMTVDIGFYITIQFPLTCTYAPKRIYDRIVHSCKFALFPGCAKPDTIK